MKPLWLYVRYASFRDRTDTRSLAVLFSTAGAIPLPAIALLSTSFVREGSAGHLLCIWVMTTTVFLITLVVGRLSDRLFTVLGFLGIVGIAMAAYLVTDPAAARGIITLLSVIPAIAAMASSSRVVLAHTAVAVACACVVSIAVSAGIASALVNCAASVSVIGLPVFIVGTLRRSLDISRARYRELANTDPLTRLPNRRGFLDRVTAHIQGNPQHEAGVGFLVIDVDHFKQVNDQFGHAVGDEVLRSVVAAVCETVDPRVLVGRFGGEEFVAFFPASQQHEVSVVAERIRAAVAAACDVTVSIGAAWCVVINRSGAVAMTLSELIDVLTRRADALMYEAKDAGRNTIRCEQSPDMCVDLLLPEQINAPDVTDVEIRPSVYLSLCRVGRASSLVTPRDVPDVPHNWCGDTGVDALPTSFDREPDRRR